MEGSALTVVSFVFCLCSHGKAGAVWQAKLFDRYLGLWEVCSDLKNSDDYCDEYDFDALHETGFGRRLQAARALFIMDHIGCVCLLVVISLLLVTLLNREPGKLTLIAAAGVHLLLSTLACVCATTAYAKYSDDDSRGGDYSLGWATVLPWTGCALSFLIILVSIAYLFFTPNE